MPHSPDHLETLLRETNKPREELLEQAVQTGLRQMWREQILARFIRGELTREQAVEKVGLDWVELAERQSRAMQEDLEWAMRAPEQP